jgi:formylmethanofuran dehydrogenase subunit E
MESLFKEAARLRGHMCLGIPLGVRMGLRGLELLDVVDKKKRDSLMVVVEANNCTADGIQVATGCSAGSRRLRVFDYGRSAAVFYDGVSGRGFRVATRPEFQAQAVELGLKQGLIKEGQAVEESSQLEREIQKNAFLRMPKEELLDCREVKVTARALLLQNRLQPRKVCARCGEVIMDGKGISRDNEVFCYPCFYGSYFVAL